MQTRNSIGWSPGPVLFFLSKQGELHETETGRLFRIILRFDFSIETGPVGHPLELESAKSANPARVLLKIDQ